MLKVDFKTRLRSGDITYLAAILIMFVLPLHYRYLPPFMILFGLGWIFEYYSGSGKIPGPSPRYKILFIAFVLFYLCQIASLLYTSDQKMGWSNVFGRLSIIIFPLFFFNPGEKIRIKSFTLIKAFSLGTLVYVLTCFAYAFYRSIDLTNGTLLFNPHPPEYDWQNYFYGADLTYSIHPSYLAMFVLFSVLISFESFYDKSIAMFYRIGWIMVGVFLLTTVYFISSRAAILAEIIVLPFYAITRIIKFKKSRFLWIGFIVILVLSLPLIRKNDRVNNLLIGFSKENYNLKNQDERIIIWESATRVIRHNLLLGVGIGDVRNELTNEYLRRGEDKLGKEKLNAHNQFLEVLLEGGLISFFIFISILGFMIYIAVNEKNMLYGVFILIMIIFFIFETVLYRLAGVAFFSLFSFLLLHLPKNEIS